MVDSSFVPPLHWEAKVQEEKLGELNLPTGKIIACDPTNASFPEECIAFEMTVPPGMYPFYLGISDLETTRHFARNVYSVLQFSEAIPVRWELALLPSQHISDLSEGRFYGFGVDSGLACFLDESFLADLTKYVEVRGSDLKWDCMVELAESSNRNIALYMAGMGDGAYPTFWGLDKVDRPCRLLTDFQILCSPREVALQEAMED